MNNLKEQALHYHEYPQPGKTAVIPTKPYDSPGDLSLAYSPGVAYPCLAIKDDPAAVRRYTGRSNLVAVISNGTAVLGLGNIGPLAAKPVMEGKALLFKIYAGIDAYDIELDAADPEAFIAAVKAMAPTFGGINLEDIKAPESFYIETELRKQCDIPIMHDDQHGTSIISGAALLNACEIQGKKLEDIKLVINGAGGAAISCGRIYKRLGVKAENIVMCDSKGVIRKDRDQLTEQKREFATDRDLHTLDEAIVGADVFLGVSVGNVLTPAMLMKMAPKAIVFALANPTPEIDYELAKATRPDIIVATGRSDYPNQVNNVLGFPYIFRGALDSRASTINEDMKVAATYAIARLAHEPVPQQVLDAYGVKELSFGPDYILPKPVDKRLLFTVSPAVAKAAEESGVARNPIKDWDKYRQFLESVLPKQNEKCEK